MLRRIMNVVMAVTGPVFYGILARLPYVVAGGLCVMYSCAFIIYTSRQQRDNSKRITELFAQVGGVEKEECVEIVKKFNRLTMASSECMARMAESTLKLLELEDDDAEKGDMNTTKKVEEEEEEEDGDDDNVGEPFNLGDTIETLEASLQKFGLTIDLEEEE